LASEPDEITVINTSVNMAVSDREATTDHHKVDMTWQTRFKQLKWVDELTKEPLCDEAVVFDEKVYRVSPDRRIPVYPKRRPYLLSIVKGKKHA
jgi:hypothetical protein